MATPRTSETASAPGDGAAPSGDERSALDSAIAALARGAALWSGLTLDQRARLLERTAAGTGAVVEEWARTAAAVKGLDPLGPLAGEEWLTGPYSLLTALDATTASLRALSRGRSPASRLRVRTTHGGRAAFDVFPRTPLEHVLLMGFRGEVWMRPGVTPSRARTSAGLAQRTPAASGGVGLVLGAGNVTAIPVLDVLSELVSANRVSLLKLNPTMDPLLPVFERALAPLVELGLVRIVRGGPEVGAYLTRHPGIEHVHVTGSGATFDAIVWGTGEEAARRRAEDDPALRVPITAELGGVSPVIVVPGRWSAADLRFQAQHVATMRLHNSGHNCVAGQVVVVSSDWDQREAFLAELAAAYARAPQRPVWYPHAAERMAAAEAAHPGSDVGSVAPRLLVELDEDAAAGSGSDAPRATASGPDVVGASGSDVETVEYFAPVLGVRELPGTGREFLDAAIAYANERLTGSLGANVLIDPEAEHELGPGFEEALEQLRYGVVAINAWTGAAFVLPTLPWGAYPGGTLRDVGSGIGTVHNAYLFDEVERAVLRGPFRPFPRSVTGGGMTLLPTPPWFVGARTATRVSEGLTRQLVDADPIRLLGTVAAAYRA